MTIKIVLVDDHHVVRKGLALLLNSHPDMSVIGEGTNGKEAIELAKKLTPEIMIMDLLMPVMDGIDATKHIVETIPNMKVLILTSMSDQDHAIPALDAGASGYLLKESDPEELILAIKKAVNGEIYIHSKITAELMTVLQTNKSKQNSLESLTQREKEVLKEITHGKSNKEIASALYITEKTVKTHVSNILSKLELQDRTQAALFAIRNGF
ncbi:response regulator transcription factor [Pradoshia sp. D12]|uniref:response regulator n=1 Tax=Bacillaceae TaxID=186817 RepID=UPI00112E4244|nr:MULTISPECIES: response regulator transcription factor [Bacillaceae]QFK70737.1 response regulator transcription factor [Pradoshia sp. D12]TPF72531.1 response regulator transcription factor [Bacillus sp. D12]